MKSFIQFISTAVATAFLCHAGAAVPAEDVKQLGANLTPWGADKAGSKDGAIPPYTGEEIQAPAGYKAGSGRLPDPFADERPLFRIDAGNMDKHADKLSESAKTLLRRWPTYRIDVYRTHRSAAYPKFFGDNSVKNAARARIVDGGMGVEGAYGGIPFPSPKSGIELIWNHYLRYMPLSLSAWWPTIMVDAAGRHTHIASVDLYFETPYYDPARTSLDGFVFNKMLVNYVEPPRSAGEKNLAWYSTNFSKQDFAYWLYTPGQRRVRLAPEAKYDTPSASFGGSIFFDEVSMFSGPPDRFDFKLAGKKEMYIPYNAYRAIFGPADKVLGPKHVNPDELRWELHRVWVVEATLKADKRHAYGKRVFYFDEDTWYLVGTEGYDHAGKLYRVGQGYPAQYYDAKHPFPYTTSFAIYDLVKGTYTFFDQMGDPRAYVKLTPRRPAYETSPEAMAGSGLR